MNAMYLIKWVREYPAALQINCCSIFPKENKGFHYINCNTELRKPGGEKLRPHLSDTAERRAPGSKHGWIRYRFRRKGSRKNYRGR